MGFSDFAGSTLVHSVGGWAALAGAILLGARDGKYSSDGSVNTIPGCSLPMTTLGVFILWLDGFDLTGIPIGTRLWSRCQQLQIFL